MINSAKGRLVAFDNKKNLELIGLIFEADGGVRRILLFMCMEIMGIFITTNSFGKCQKST